jgi:RNA 2',3'-cyclic 3'-phosphodiesterase
MRLFIGIQLADAVVGELSAVVSRLRASERETSARVSGLHWTAPESWHITLQFLGSSTLEQLRCLTDRLGEVRSAPVEVQIEELGFFDRAGVFFAEVAVVPRLIGLQRSVLSATSTCGFAAETRPFHPHITLARMKGRRRGTDLRDLPGKIHGEPSFTRFAAHEFLLYESHTEPKGARYEIRRRFPLNDL